MNTGVGGQAVHLFPIDLVNLLNGNLQSLSERLDEMSGVGARGSRLWRCEAHGTHTMDNFRKPRSEDVRSPRSFLTSHGASLRADKIFHTYKHGCD